MHNKLSIYLSLFLNYYETGNIYFIYLILYVAL